MPEQMKAMREKSSFIHPDFMLKNKTAQKLYHEYAEQLPIIDYVGGGSQGWAWGLMSDLAAVEDLSGTVALYDINYEAAKTNETIGNRYNDLPDCKSKWS